VRRDGEVIHILTRNRVVMDSEGRVLKAAGVNQDITARKKMDEALRESEARYRSLFESSLDGIMLTQPDGTVLAVNRRACEMLRMTEEEIVRAGRAGIVVDDERLQAALAERAKTGKWQGELTHRRSDGSTFPAEISSNVFAGADGKEMAAMVLRDITERKLAEQALKESKARLDLALQSASMGVWYWDLVEDRRSFDDQVCHLLGIEPAAFTGTADEFFDAVHPDDREMLKAALTRTIEHDVPYEPEYRAVWPDGSIHYIAARGRLVRHDASNRPERINGIIWDITERKQAEAYREAGREILQILNEAGDLQDTIQRVLTVLKTRIGFDAVGIRLQDGDDFPYIAQEGFSQDFLLAENALIERAADGGVCRDRDGKARLEGTCGMVISGKTDPANPLFTPRGSWWTNDSLALLDILPGEDPRFHPRNRCVHLGYASVALVPIRTRDSIVGLVHLNDRRKGRFTVDTVEFLEGIASHIGQALMRKRAEDALRESETKLRAIFDGSRDAIGVSKDGIHFFANPAYVSLFGYENADELIGKPTTEFVAPESRGLVNERVEKRAKGEAVPPSYEATGLRKDGTTFLLEATISLYALKGEQFTLAVLRDITERKRAEEEVKLFKHSVDVHYDGAYWINADNEFIYVNGAACKILGYERDELIGKPISLVSSRVTDEAMKGIWERLRKRGSFLGEGVHRRRDGSEFPADIVATYVQFGGKEYACGFARDITDKKRLEDQLRQAQKMEAVGTLAGGVAHDFNNILTVIMGLGNLMQMEIDEDDIHRAYIDQIVASSERAADLTQSLLAFSRKQRITLEPHKVNGVVTSTAKLLTRLLPEDIRLSMNLTDKDTSSLLDVTQIGQVLMNLATNARDAMPHGGSLTIATERAKIDKTFTKTHGFGRTGDYVKLSVSDTGIGIDESTTKRIFEPFFTTKEVGKGTGLGLASVYGIVKQHNGYVTVSSVPFTGTTFDIYLPLIKAPSRQKARAKGEIKGGTETILIVEDDRDVRHVLTSILEGQGYTTIEAVDGDDAIKTHCEHKEDIELIILDVVMPLRNGKEILDEITRVDPLAKAIFISGYTGDVAIDKGIHSDSVDFLQKPLSIPALLAKVREVLDR
ncbi:MAG: PAS domain S-box protein, partial [Syntrophorhabdales bacterium]